MSNDELRQAQELLEQQARVFERQAVEVVGAAKGLLKEFENRIGELVSAQRVAGSEARAEGVQVMKQLQEIGRRTQTWAEQHQRVIAKIESDWQLRIDDNATRAGIKQAEAFGEGIATGLRQQLTGLAHEVRIATHRFTWAYFLMCALGIGIAIPITIIVGVWALTPRVPGLSQSQIKAAASRLATCQVEQDWHVCVPVDDKPVITKAPNGEKFVVIQGM